MGCPLPDENPFRQFYEQGGYVGNGAAGKRLKMALWGSQYMADGGKVMPPFNLAYGSQYFSRGGGVDDLVKAMIELHRACGGRV